MPPLESSWAVIGVYLTESFVAMPLDNQDPTMSNCTANNCTSTTRMSLIAKVPVMGLIDGE